MRDGNSSAWIIRRRRPKNSAWLRWFTFVASAILLLHASALLLLPSSLLASDLAICCASALSVFAAFHSGQQCTGVSRFKWFLFTAGLGLWCAGQVFFTYYEGIRHLRQDTALNSDFFFFLFGVPILLAISSSNERKGTAWSLLLDAFQAVLAIYLIRLQLFPGFDRSEAQKAISCGRLMYAYDIENAILVCAATFRVLSGSQGEENLLYKVICAFLWCYSVLAAFLNYASYVRLIPTGTYLDLLWDLPFLLLPIALLALPPRPMRSQQPKPNHVALLITSASPVFFTAALLTMATYVARDRFVLGISCMLFALLCYLLRSSILQVRYMAAEHRLLESETALRTANERLEQISYMDALTGVPNRRRFEEILTAEWNRALRSRSLVSLLIIDLDHFKLLNDHYGHPHGDYCLLTVAKTLAGNLRRSGELLARYGGEEFVAVLPNVDSHHALLIAEEMRDSVLRLGIANEKAPRHKLTISIGTATCVPEPGSPCRDFISTADQALYRAKSQGRNCVKQAQVTAGV